MQLRSKLPQVGTTIFTTMSGLAAQYGAINLSQGFPNYDCDPKLKNSFVHYINAGYNQYAPMTGVPRLNEVLSRKIASLYHTDFCPKTEINICSGATQAIFSAIHAFVHAGDEVILIEPAYDCYQPAIVLAGGKAVPYQLKGPDWKIDWKAFQNLISDKTRMIILNTPHNPTGSVLNKSDFEALEQIVDGSQILILSDEVYEHMTFDGHEHHSILSFPTLRERSMATFSFGKTLHATGWKIGYIVADANMMQEFRKVHQYDVFCSNTPVQYAIADYLEEKENYMALSSFFQNKRDLFLQALKDAAFEFIPSKGTYFQVASYKKISTLSDVEFSKKMTRDYGVAVIPLSVFYNDSHDDHLIRFCFAKTDELLLKAADKINMIPSLS